MNQPSEGDARRRNRRLLFASGMILLCGAPILLNVSGNPRLATLRWPDIIQLFCSGMIIGAGLVPLGIFFVGLLTDARARAKQRQPHKAPQQTGGA
jgi:hypothetical protein